MTEGNGTSDKKVVQSMVGTVMDSPMDKTAVVAIEKTVVHRLYRRRFK